MIVTDFPNIADGPGFTYGVFNNDYDRPPLKIEPGGTVTCIAGCTGAADTLTATRLGDAPFTNWDKVIDPVTGLPNYNNNTTIWPDHHYDYRGPWNAMTGWYIGDVNPDPEGQDRILRFTYQIKAPTVQEMYDLAVARRIGTWTTQTILDNPTYVKALSSFEYTNYVQLSMQTGNRNWDVNTFNPDWTAGYNPLELTHGGSRTWINATVDFKVEYPVLEDREVVRVRRRQNRPRRAQHAGVAHTEHPLRNHRPQHLGRSGLRRRAHRRSRPHGRVLPGLHEPDRRPHHQPVRHLDDRHRPRRAR